MPDIGTFRSWAEEVCWETNFLPVQELSTGLYYSQRNIRSLTIGGTYQSHPAVLKLYDDPRVCLEPRGLRAFHEHNRSQVLTAPKLLASYMISAKKGWLIMEPLPEGGEWYPRPMSLEQRRIFLKLYQEYRTSFPTVSPDERSWSEHLTAGEFHSFRIARWFQLANDAIEEAAIFNRPAIIDPASFMPGYEWALAVIRKQFRGRAMIWSLGHFKAKEVYILNGGQRAYLIDFAHVKYYPEGYELAFMAWADWMMTDTWRWDRTVWRDGIESWSGDLVDLAAQLGYARPYELVRASLLERVVGGITADVLASDRSPEEKAGYLRHFLPLMRDLTAELR